MIEPFAWGFGAGAVVWMFWGRRICEYASRILPSFWPK